MKKLLTLLLSLFLILKVSGQEVHQVEDIRMTYPIGIANPNKVDSGFDKGYYGTAMRVIAGPPDRYDTVKVVMVITDTAESYIRDGMGSYRANKNPLCYIADGWAVVKNRFYTTQYLDAEKKKLSHNVIVWMAKNNP